MSIIKIVCPTCNNTFDKVIKNYNQAIKNGHNIYCSRKCSYEYEWLNKKSIINKTGIIQFGCEEHNRRMSRRFLIETLGNQCSICKQTHWMNKDIPLVLDHIDGNALNYNVNNLRMVCGNCNMQLDTFAGKNKGKGTRGKTPHI